MFLRMAAIIGALQPALAVSLGGYLLVLALAAFLGAAVQWQGQRGEAAVAAQPRLFDLPTAIGFGMVLGVMAVLARAAKDGLGLAGIYGVAFVSGLADVDAMVISSVQMQAQGELAADAATIAILLAAAANMAAKAAMAWAIGGRALGVRVVGGFLAIAVAGLAATGVRML